MARTLGQLVDDVRSRLGIPSGDQFKTHAEIAEMIRESSHELADVYWNAFDQEAFMSNSNFSTTAATYFFAAPLVAIRRVHVVFDGIAVPIRRIQLDTDTYDTASRTWFRGLDISYLFQYIPYDPVNGLASYIQFFPPPSQVYDVVIWYHLWPAFYTTSVSTQVNSLGFDEYIVLDACAKYAISEESDPTPFLAQKEAFKQRILNMAGPKDVSQAQVIRDVRGLGGRIPDRGY